VIVIRFTLTTLLIGRDGAASRQTLKRSSLLCKMINQTSWFIC